MLVSEYLVLHDNIYRFNLEMLCCLLSQHYFKLQVQENELNNVKVQLVLGFQPTLTPQHAFSLLRAES